VTRRRALGAMLGWFIAGWCAGGLVEFYGVDAFSTAGILLLALLGIAGCCDWLSRPRRLP
jgi:hypothetical protein